MRKLYIIVAIGFVTIFVGITFLRQESHKRSGSSSLPANSTDETIAKENQLQFWEHYRKATEARIQNNYKKAVEEYRQALGLNPDHEDALYYYGLVNLYLDKSELAEKQWLRLTELNFRSTRGYMQLGKLYFTEHRALNKAESAFRKANEISPEETGPMYYLAILALFNEQGRETQNYLESILGFNENDIHSRFLLGYIFWKDGKTEQAREQLEQVQAALNDKNVKSNEFVLEGDAQEGKNSLQQAELNPINSIMQPVLQAIQRKNNDMQDAYNAFDQSLNTLIAQ